MKLYHSPASPYARKVRILMHEADILDDVELIATTGGPTDPTTMPIAENPLGKIPTLVRDDGPAIYDSRVITRYLDSTFQTGFYPESRIWDVLTLEATADGILDAALLIVYEGRFRPEDLVHQPWVDAQWSKIARALDALESRWGSHLAGPLDMGQIAVGAALGYLDLRHDARNWRDGHAGLATWFKTISARESFVATVPS